MKSMVIILVVCTLINPLAGFAQEKALSNGGDDVFQARLIKINRMSVGWKNEPMELKLQNGTKYSGRFLSLQNNLFRLQSASNISEIPFMEVETIVLKRKPQDLWLVGLATIGVAALFAGGTTLGFDASDQAVVGASAVGAVLGFAVGWRAFYQDVEILLQ
jgi:hypothetical protein